MRQRSLWLRSTQLPVQPRVWLQLGISSQLLAETSQTGFYLLEPVSKVIRYHDQSLSQTLSMQFLEADMRWLGSLNLSTRQPVFYCSEISSESDKGPRRQGRQGPG